ncbi:MAG: hypothetical protein CM1200mP9_07770 [Gammaproteobacteria bacterium]|nr:MAG: hypothetical protein CM1200mP9_07770 [Gammaproteobacteria bacterium]
MDPAEDSQSVTSPVTLNISAFGPVTDARRVITPELRVGNEILLYLNEKKPGLVVARFRRFF